MTLTVILIFAVTTILACALGAVSGYFFYRARHREAFAEPESLDHEPAEHETERRRLKYQASNASMHTPAGDETSAAAWYERIASLQEEVEQRTLDLNILRQDYDMEMRILKQEIDQFRTGQHEELRQARHQLDVKRAELDGLRDHLDAKQRQLREAREQLDAEHRARTAEHEARHKAREAALAGQEAALARREAALAEREAALAERKEHVDKAGADEQETFAAAPPAQQEALLVKRLRQQIRLQEEELAQLRLGQATPSLRPPAAAAAAAPEAAARTPAPLPSFSPLSSFIDSRGIDSRGPAPDGQANGKADAPATARTARHDALTHIPGITGPIQSALYEMGFTSFEQIARLNSADVRRIAERLGIDRRTIQDRWILEAQAHLFEEEA